MVKIDPPLQIVLPDGRAGYAFEMDETAVFVRLRDGDGAVLRVSGDIPATLHTEGTV